MNKLDELSVFFPAYNEQDNIAGTVDRAFSSLYLFAKRFEVIVVNDGSGDNTAAVLDILVKKYANLKIVTHERNKGYGAAIKSGFANSGYKYVFFADGDGQFDISDLRKLIPLLSYCDMAAGIRVKRQDKFYRILNAKLYNLLVRFLFGLKINDIDCAFKIIKKNVIDSICLNSDSQFISAEMLIKAKKKGFIIRQVEVNHLPREKGKATGNNPIVVIKAFRELFRLWKELK